MNSIIKIYADENISHAIVHGIRNRGIDIISCWEAGMISKSDLEQIEFAKKQNRVIITHDTDFLILHKKGISHSGVVYIHPKKTMRDILNKIHLIYFSLTAEDFNEHLEFI